MSRSTGIIAGFVGLMSRSLIAATGVVLATGGAVLIVVLFAIDMTTGRSNPYFGILAFVILPALFVVGLLLIPLGAWTARRRRREPPDEFQTLVSNPTIRRRLAIVALATIVNVAILTTASFRAVEVMDTREFCGQTCHSVMAPEATAAPLAPHARVLCVSCHVGPGAGGYVRAKLNGVSQLVHLATGTYSRPIPVPIEGGSPARGVCLDCHALTQFRDEKLRIIRTYAPDETSTPSTTVLMLKIGGLPARSDRPRGIHWHVFPENVVEYQASDTGRSVIPRVRVRPSSGPVREYVGETSPASGTPAAAAAPAEWHRMDCVDCHNRPAHTFQLPSRAIDAALAEGRLDRSLPWIKKNAMDVLMKSYPDRSSALSEIPRALAKLYPGGPAVPVREAGEILAGIYSRNVFPEMKIGWGTYPNHIGHTDFPGCFRCHDGAHKSADGGVITDDCSACHSLLAVEDPAPEVLKALHPDA